MLLLVHNPSLNIALLVFSRSYLITDDGLESLGKSFEGLPSISHLALNCEGCKQITDQGLISLGKSLQKAASLQCLALCFLE